MGRKLKSYNTLKDGANAAQAQVLVAQSNYNELGQLKQKGLHSLNGTSFLQNVDYRYNARGWLTNINNGSLTNDPLTSTDLNDQFGMDLKYDDAATPQYNGNIGSVKTLTGALSGATLPALTYNYTYDKLNRLTDAISTTSAANDGFYSETLVYDNMGNIQTLKRYDKNGAAAQLIDNLNYIYVSGNKVDRIDDAGTTAGFNNAVSQAGEYTYDGNGSQLTDLNRGLTQAYNMLNLPQTVTKSGISIAYIYDATGRKLRKLSTNSGITTVTEYIAGIQYQYSTATPVLDFISTEEGRARKSGSVYKYEYDLKDHLGNTRITTTWNASDATQMTPLNSQRSDYYAFGYAIQSLQGTTPSPKNQYLYNHKELQEETGLYDYGARFYDPVIGRWGVVDPLVEAGQESTSPYGYVFDDPIRLTDPDGRVPCCGGFSDVVDLAAGAVHAYLSDITTGNLPPAQYGNSSVGAFGEKLGHVVAFGQGLSEMGSGGTGAVAGVVGAPETFGASLAIEAPSIALAGHGAFTSKNAVVGLLSGNGVLNASSAQPSSDQTPQKEPNGNSHASQKPQHGYEIYDKTTGEIMEYGISGQKTKQDHTGTTQSPRIRQKLKTKYANDPNIDGRVIAWFKNRKESTQWEKDQVTNFKDNNDGRKPSRQIRP